MDSMSETLTLRGELKGHSGWVTCLATTEQNASFLLSGSRGACHCHCGRMRPPVVSRTQLFSKW